MGWETTTAPPRNDSSASRPCSRRRCRPVDFFGERSGGGVHSITNNDTTNTLTTIEDNPCFRVTTNENKILRLDRGQAPTKKTVLRSCKLEPCTTTTITTTTNQIQQQQQRQQQQAVVVPGRRNRPRVNKHHRLCLFPASGGTYSPGLLEEYIQDASKRLVCTRQSPMVRQLLDSVGSHVTSTCFLPRGSKSSNRISDGSVVRRSSRDSLA